MEKTQDKAVHTESHKMEQNELMEARKKQITQSKDQNSKDFKWLTSHSRNFLAAGYIPQGQTPELRIKEIADRAETILGIDGFSNKFFNYMSEGFYSLSSPVWSNFGKKKRSASKLFWL